MKRHLLTLLISFSISFLTFAQAPTNLAVNNVFNTTAILSWQKGNCAQLAYTLSYKDSLQSNWDSVVVTNNGNNFQVYSLTGLNSVTTYEWRLKCGTTWVNGPNFTTSNIFSFNYVVTDATCSGSNDGAIDLTVSGGSPPYTYSWSSPLYTWFNETTEDINTLFSGMYYINVTDALGASETDSVFVSIVDSHSINQIVNNFTVNPVTVYGQWTNTLIQLINTGCDVNLRPEFLITHDSLAITQGDFDLQWFNPLTAQFANLPYSVNNNGHAYGFWHYTSNGPNPDSTGIIVNEGSSQLLTVRVRFNNNPTNTANHGLYSFIWDTKEVDYIGNIIQSLDESDTINLLFSNNIYGCTDSTALNYNPMATIDDSSCILPVYGCTDSTAQNYNPLANVDDASCIYSVTFNVDMNHVDSTTFSTPEVNGTFNGWCGNCDAMTDIDGDNVWEVTINLPNGFYEFKYSADSWNIQENLSGSWCTVSTFGFTNRSLIVSGDTTLSVVCWESCDACNLGPSSYDVTFEVDMRGVTQPFTTPEINGTFNGWCGNCWQMSDADGDSIWQLQMSFVTGDSIVWKYSADNWNIQEDLDSSLSCVTIFYDSGAPNGWGYVNRFAVINSDTIFSSPWNFCNSYCDDSSCVCDLTTSFTNVFPSDSISCDGISIISASSSYPIVSYSWEDQFGNIVSTIDYALNLCNDIYFITIVDSLGCTSIDTLLFGSIYGCTDSSAINYFWGATVDDGSCIPAIYGCTDPFAINYDSLANVDNGSCCVINFGNISLLNYCGSMPYSNANVNISEVRLIGDNGDNIINNTSTYGDDYEDFTNQYASLTPNNTYTITVEIGSVNPNHLINEFAGAKVYADWNTDGDFFDLNEELGIINVDTVPFITDVTFTVPNTLTGYVTRLRVVMQENNDSIIGPCDSTYFDPSTFSFIGPIRGATEDYSIVINTPSACAGCTDPIALNYDSTLAYDDGSCIYPSGCTDPLAYNYDSIAITDDGSCLYCDLTNTMIVSQNTLGNCNGFIIANSSSSNNPITYLWSNGGTGTNIIGLCSGVYSVIITDNVGCTIEDTIYMGVIAGCTDSLALNYDPNATIDDGSCLYTDCNGINYGPALVDSCGVCQLAYVYNFITHVPTFINDTAGLILGPTEILVLPNDSTNPLWNSSCSGCTDPNATNYDSTSTIDDGSCVYGAAPLFFSEHSDGGGFNRYFEIYNPTQDTVVLDDYAWARVGGNPTTPGIYETWNNFATGAVILPHGVYIVAHVNSDGFILNQADMISQLLSNGDDGLALVYGVEPATPTHPDSGLYTILDWVGDWNGDPGTGWDVAGVSEGTANHTLVRKCGIMMGDTSWSNAAGTDSLNSQWIVFGYENWNYLGFHSNSPVYASTFDTICNGLSITVNGNVYSSSGVYNDTLTSIFGCDSIVTTNLYVLSQSASFLNLNPTICYGDSVYVDGVPYYQTGFYTTILTNSVGCDSIITLDLRVVSPTNLVYDICPGDSIYVGSNVYFLAGNYTDTLVASGGCDSIINTEINIYSQYNSVYGGIPNNNIGGGGYYTGDQHLILDCYVPSKIVSATVYSDGNTIYEFELRDSNGVTLADTIYALVNGANFVTLNFEMPVGTDFELGVSPASNFGGLYRNNAGVNYPYDFGNLASITQSSAQQFGDYYYYYYNIEITSLVNSNFGCMNPAALNYDSLAICPDTCIFPQITYGCTDPLAFNYDSLASIDDGSCIYANCTSPKPTGLYAYDVIDTRAKIGWDNMNDPSCMVWKYFVRYREVGTSQWTTKSAGVGNGLCNFGLNTVTKQLLNLTPSTTYEFRMKAFYCGGTSSNYSAPVQFTTADVCPDMTNLSTTTFNGNQAKVRFNWDTTGAYTFARILLRVDTAGSAWQTAGGFGVYYPTLFVNKFGLTPGQSYRAQGRTFCDSNITAYRSPTWTVPIFWTQPGSIREGGGLSINNLDIYPNPSRDVFNITFTSEKEQDLRIRILSVVGAEVYREDRENFIGEYTKQVSLDNYGKGIYFLEIETKNGVINKKLILQ